jgi:hypothetical protein
MVKLEELTCYMDEDLLSRHKALQREGRPMHFLFKLRLYAIHHGNSTTTKTIAKMEWRLMAWLTQEPRAAPLLTSVKLPWAIGYFLESNNFNKAL